MATTAARTRPTAWLVALRPRQWTKNLLVFAGIIFAGELGDPRRLVEALGVFVAYCAASSAAYLLNAVRDAEHDRLHPIKRDRPVASGLVSPRAALGAAAVLALAAFAIAAVLGRWSVVVLCAFVALQLAYSLGLKHVVLIDVMAIAGLFVIRAVAGAVAVHVPISPWLLLCTGTLALFLALAKRRGELVLVGAERTPGRPVLEGYSLALVDQLVTIVAASTVIAYALYTFTARPGDRMMATIPFVLFGVFRYLLLIHREDAGEEPEQVLLSDRPILICVALWALTAALLLINS
ncbi:MAG: decaprenyl-phosphate phosphoribosyltransferase [Gaiellaceae bacterium]